jgi:hypothetical protein
MKEVKLKTDYVPRVGELINTRGFFKHQLKQSDIFFETKVIYEATRTGLVPHVTCKQWWKGDRLFELQERRWLPSEDFKGSWINDDQEL